MVLHRIKQSKTYLRVAAWTKRYERFWMPLFLMSGLFADVLQFTALNIWQQFLFIGVYVVVAAGASLIMHNPAAPQTRGFKTLSLISPFAYQFAVGGLLSTSLLFYWFSGAQSVSWPLLLIVAAFMLGNEFVRQHFLRPTVQMAVLSFSLFSLSAILFSFVFNSLSAGVFLLSGGVSLVFMLGFMLLLTSVVKLRRRRGIMLITISAVFALMSAAYFGNIIPPIPLAIREAGIYHDMRNAGLPHAVDGEPESWLDQILPGQTIHASTNEPLYAYTSIFAPTNLTTTVVHKWQYYDPTSNDWVTKATLTFPITGGRDEGYRGYSRKSHLAAGKWRVSVETPRGQVLGRIKFTAILQ